MYRWMPPSPTHAVRYRGVGLDRTSFAFVITYFSPGRWCFCHQLANVHLVAGHANGRWPLAAGHECVECRSRTNLRLQASILDCREEDLLSTS